jgi:L-2,4-diaminobutyrate decarboxylase
VHEHDAATEALTEAIVRYSVERVRLDPPPLDCSRSYDELFAAAGETVTAEGLGGLRALEVFRDVLAPATISTDHTKFLSFVPAAPTEASILFDLVVGASSIFGGSWLEGAGAVFAENQALRWIAGLAGLPQSAGGVFVSGGTNGNLSALIAARFDWRLRTEGRNDRVRGLMLASSGSHSSIAAAARAMDADIIKVAADDRGRMDATALQTTVDQLQPEDLDRVFVVVATAGTTNAGVIDDLDGAGRIAAELGVWFHVDGAYGAAALCSPTARVKFAGIERCDSFIVDPHKWLYAPFDSCALVYRNPELGRAAHTQHAEYLDVLHGSDAPLHEMNPSDYAHHLSRRARGLPFWFSLATYGTDAYGQAVDATLEVTAAAAEMIRSAPHLELLMEPDLSVLLFRRTGWTAADYDGWSEQQLRAGESFVVPTAWRGETVLRFCFVHPRTTAEQVAEILDSLV